MPPTPTALLMTALALLRLPACSGFRMARVSEPLRLGREVPRAVG